MIRKHIKPLFYKGIDFKIIRDTFNIDKKKQVLFSRQTYQELAFYFGCSMSFLRPLKRLYVCLNLFQSVTN